MANAAESVMINAAKKAGFTSAALVTAIAVSLAEDPTSDPALVNKNTNGSVDRGLWQINSKAWPNYDGSRLLTDPVYNASAAYTISKAGNDWSPWVTYTAPVNVGGKANPHSYMYYMQKAELLSLGKYLDPGAADPQGSSAGLVTGLGGVAVNAADAIGNPLDMLKGLLGNIMSGAFWLRIGEGAAALGLIILGLVLLFRKSIESTVETAAKVAVP